LIKVQSNTVKIYETANPKPRSFLKQIKMALSPEDWSSHRKIKAASAGHGRVPHANMGYLAHSKKASKKQGLKSRPFLMALPIDDDLREK
jgi:hypothetical protein